MIHARSKVLPVVSPALSYRLDVLKKELDSIDNSIRKIDDIGNSIKNWAILAWTGSIAAILGKPELHSYMLFSALPPLVFLLVDAHWRKIQRRLTYRQGQIAEFLNGPGLDEAFRTGRLEFALLDPIARRSSGQQDFKVFVSLARIIKFPTISLIYAGLALLSVGMSILIFLFPPLPTQSPPSPTSSSSAAPAPSSVVPSTSRPASAAPTGQRRP